MDTYILLQQYWWFIISLLGGILAFLLFVQGTNSMLFSIGRTETERGLIIASTGRKWEFTFTTLVLFGGAFFASFPFFYCRPAVFSLKSPSSARRQYAHSRHSFLRFRKEVICRHFRSNE